MVRVGSLCDVTFVRESYRDGSDADFDTSTRKGSGRVVVTSRRDLMLAYLGYELPSKESLGAAPFSEFGDDNDSVIDFDVASVTSSVASSIPRLFSPAGASAVADGDVDVDVDYDDADSVASKDSIASTIYRAYAPARKSNIQGSRLQSFA